MRISRDILLVIGVVVIATGYGVFSSFHHALCNSHDGEATGTISALNAALSVYYGRNGDNFPNHPSPVDIRPNLGRDISGGEAYDFGQYYATTPPDLWSGGQNYRYRGTREDYSLSIRVNGGIGCDGIEGTPDDCFFYNNSKGRIVKTDSATCL